MGSKSSSFDSWRKYFQTANSDIFEVIEHAILVAASDYPKELKMQRDRIAETLYSCRFRRCTGCDHVESVPEKNEEDKEDEGFKSGDDFEGAGKESKLNSTITDHHETEINGTSNYSNNEAEALTEGIEIEEENRIVGEVFRIKEILANFQDESDETLFESLRKLQFMELSVEILQATEIGKAVNRLRKHASKQIRNFTRILIDGWKHVVDERVKATAAAAITVGSEGSPDSVKPSIDEEEEEGEEGGLPSPPLDEGAFMATQAGSMEFSQFFDGINDDGNPRNSGRLDKIPENRGKSFLGNHNVSMENKGQSMKKQEDVIRQNKPFKTDSPAGRPLTSSSEHKINNEIKFRQKTEEFAMQQKQMTYRKDKSKCSDEDLVRAKLEATKRKLLEGYQQVENAKKQRTIQVMELHDLPKQGLGHRNPHVKTGNHPKNWTNGRR